MVINISKIMVCRVGENKAPSPITEEFKQKIISSGYVNQGVIYEHNNYKYFIMLLYDEQGEYNSSRFNPHRVGIASNNVKFYYDDSVFFSEEAGSVCK
jgi:hypothetical protein